MAEGFHLDSEISETAPRDVESTRGWAEGFGMQTDIKMDEMGLDYFAVTNQDLPADSPILYVPQDFILTGSKAREELFAEQAEQMLLNNNILMEKEDDSGRMLSKFYLFCKILREYELGDQSPWYPWLDALPRYFCNGASLTTFCFECLPPYAAQLCLEEKFRLNQFVAALREVSTLGADTKTNVDLTQWAFAVVHTRFQEMPNGDLSLVPMADFFNHGGYDDINVYVTYDEEGNAYAYSTRDIPAGQPLRISYGDSTNPSKLLAQYGFLDDSSFATYCKYIIDTPSEEVKTMGYPQQMLFYNDGNISPAVWDVLLYQNLGKARLNEEQQAFYQAYMAGDEATKQNYHQQYFSQTVAELKTHVDYLVNTLDELEIGIETQITRGQDAKRHPRLPLLMKHNEYVKTIFELVQQNLDNMISWGVSRKTKREKATWPTMLVVCVGSKQSIKSQWKEGEE